MSKRGNFHVICDNERYFTPGVFKYWIAQPCTLGRENNVGEDLFPKLVKMAFLLHEKKRLFSIRDSRGKQDTLYEM